MKENVGEEYPEEEEELLEIEKEAQLGGKKEGEEQEVEAEVHEEEEV